MSLERRKKSKRTKRTTTRTKTRTRRISISNIESFVAGFVAAFDERFKVLIKIDECISAFRTAGSAVATVVFTEDQSDAKKIADKIASKYTLLNDVLENANTNAFSSFFIGIGAVIGGWFSSTVKAKGKLFDQLRAYIDATKTTITGKIATINDISSPSFSQMNGWLDEYKVLFTDVYENLTNYAQRYTELTSDVPSDLRESLATMNSLKSVDDFSLNTLADASDPSKVNITISDASRTKQDSEKSAIMKLVEKIRKPFEAFSNVAKKCFGKSPSEILLSSGAALLENVALAIPVMNFIAMAWRILKTTYFVGKALYYLIKSITAEDKSQALGQALGYAIKAITYLLTGVTMRKKMSLKKRYQKKKKYLKKKRLLMKRKN